MSRLIQGELFGDPSRTAKSVAVELIEYYVKRGDPLEWLKHGQMGAGDCGESAQIGGHCEGKKFSSDFIIVSKFNGQDVCEVFKLKEIYEGVKNNA